MSTTRLELIKQARKQVKELAKETKSLWQNDAYNVCFIEFSDKTIGITKIMVNHKINNVSLVIGNKPMTKKQIIDRLDYLQYECEMYE